MSNQLTVENLNRLSEILSELESARTSTKEKSLIMDKLKAFFREVGIHTYHHTTPDGTDLTITFVDEYETDAFDAALLKSKYPDIWAECHSKKTRPANISIKKTGSKSKKKPTDAPSIDELAPAIIESATETPDDPDDGPTEEELANESNTTDDLPEELANMYKNY